MDINDYDSIYLKQLVITGLQVAEYRDNYDRTDYLYCQDMGIIFNRDQHDLIGYKLDAYKDLYISDLERFVQFYCKQNDIDLDDLKLHYIREIKKND